MTYEEDKAVYDEYKRDTDNIGKPKKEIKSPALKKSFETMKMLLSEVERLTDENTELRKQVSDLKVYRGAYEALLKKEFEKLSTQGN